MLVLPITHPIFTWSSPRYYFVQLLFCMMNLMKRTGQRTRSLTSSSGVWDNLNTATSLLLDPVDLLKYRILSFYTSLNPTSPFLPIMRPTSWSGTEILSCICWGIGCDCGGFRPFILETDGVTTPWAPVLNVSRVVTSLKRFTPIIQLESKTK